MVAFQNRMRNVVYWSFLVEFFGAVAFFVDRGSSSSLLLWLDPHSNYGHLTCWIRAQPTVAAGLGQRGRVSHTGSAVRSVEGNSDHPVVRLEDRLTRRIGDHKIPRPARVCVWGEGEGERVSD